MHVHTCMRACTCTRAHAHILCTLLPSYRFGRLATRLPRAHTCMHMCACVYLHTHTSPRLQKKAARDVSLVRALTDSDAAVLYDWEGLCRWLRSLAGPISANEALALFAEDATTACRLHVEVRDHDQAQGQADV